MSAPMWSPRRARCTAPGSPQRDGQERASWWLTAEAIVSARTVRPGGGSKRAEPTKTAPTADGAPFNDPLPWGEPWLKRN